MLVYLVPGFVVKSTDQGNTWNFVEKNNGSMWNGIFFSKLNYGLYLYGSNNSNQWYILSSSNTGSTWEALDFFTGSATAQFPSGSVYSFTECINLSTTGSNYTVFLAGGAVTTGSNPNNIWAVRSNLYNAIANKNSNIWGVVELLSGTTPSEMYSCNGLAALENKGVTKQGIVTAYGVGSFGSKWFTAREYNLDSLATTQFWRSGNFYTYTGSISVSGNIAYGCAIAQYGDDLRSQNTLYVTRKSKGYCFGLYSCYY